MPKAKTTLITPRRNFLVGALTVGAALAIPVKVQAGTDPIFAAIERHRAAYDAYFATLGEDELEAAIPRERRQSSFAEAYAGNSTWRVETDDPAWIAHIEEGCRTSAEEDEAASALVSTDNLTPAGAVALLNYAIYREERGDCWSLLEDDNGRPRKWDYFLHRQIAAALQDWQPGVLG